MAHSYTKYIIIFTLISACLLLTGCFDPGFTTATPDATLVEVAVATRVVATLAAQVPTDTSVPPTDTPLPPTDTPTVVPTNTPLPSTDTPTVTFTNTPTPIPPDTPTPTATGQANDSSIGNPIYLGEQLTPGYDMGVNTSGGRTDWVIDNNGYMCMKYPDGQDWGSVFITVGKPRDFPRPSQDLSAYSTLSLELRGETGGEYVLVGLKDNTDPDDGSEMKVQVSNLITDWQTFTFPISKFATADPSRLYVVTEFVFEKNTPQTVCFRNIQYLP